MVGKIGRDLAHGDLRRLVQREMVDTRADGREIDRMAAILARKAQAVAVAAGQQLGLAVIAAAPHRTDGVDHVPRDQLVALGDLGLSCFAAVQGAALGQQAGQFFFTVEQRTGQGFHRPGARD